MTVEERRWNPHAPKTLNVSANSYQPQDVADSLLDRVYSPLAASIWGDRSTTTIPTSNRTHSRFSHVSTVDAQEEGTGGDSEMTAMLKLSANLRSLIDTQDEDDTRLELSASKLLLRAPSPGSTAIFSADLERVNTWFKEELQDDTQRLMVLFSLVQLMPEWQQYFLVQLLEQRRTERIKENNNIKASIMKPPPGLDSKPPSPVEQRLNMHLGIIKPSSAPPHIPSAPLSWRRSRDTSSPIEETPSQSTMTLATPAPRRNSILIQQDEIYDAFPGYLSPYTHLASQIHSAPLSPTQQALRQDDPYASLFWSDLYSWLRCLRLHKYDPIFRRVSRQTFLNWSATDLESAGVTAMGARNKFLRLFEQIKAQQQTGQR